MADLTIRGAGIFGLTIAWEALRRGATVRVIDPNGPGAGASGGLVGALQPHTPDVWNAKKQFQFEALLRARTLWPEIEAASGISTGYARAGRLQPLPGEREVVMARARAAGAAEFWGEAAEWRVIPSDEAGAWRPPSESGLYIHDTLSALIHPRQAVTSLTAALAARGVTVETEGEDAGAVVWAKGWTGLADLGQALGKKVGSGVKGQAALLAHDAAGAPQIFASSLHIVPHRDGTVAIGSTSERDFDAPTATDALLDDIVERATEIMPILHGARVIERWAGVRPRAQSRAPLLGAWPGRPGHFVANGGFKIGFGVAPRVAEVMCDLVLDGRNAIPAEFGFDAL
ncbi:FAD-dependent oxidoreductase [Alphaproteobacteria bacterium GH1-50]|uniref:FAD-dependent oxidoreductase n=1 Tax=Kangsaoukella pontilimi TaxID=2691042 RepID=A0A7C9MI59_9RHOB|nr:FAD-dependent oxidoreductase [Kangsaoukella pontilimi]MXQ09496.1 FAD-dependent oxidoreductase [Kangsaoukella pontilimi]